jgi:hypothetical protein
MIRGSCLCGEVRWGFEALQMMSHCHCSICRKVHGSAFGSHAMGAASGFSWQSGESLIGRFESSPGNPRAFCTRCGSVVAREIPGELFSTPAGNLDDDPGIRPMAHIYAASGADWHPILDDLPQFDTLPPGLPEPDVAPRVRAGASRADAMRGSCLCGDVAFEVSGRNRGIVLCHCSRCRKSRSAAFGANLWFSDASFEFVHGRDQVDAYKVPEAERFMNFFCARCGSTVSKGYGRNGMLTVPAGCIDGEPPLEEKIHIFVGSKAVWFEISDSLTQLEASPGGSGGQALEAQR